MFYNHNPSPSLAHKLSHDGVGLGGHGHNNNNNNNGHGGGSGSNGMNGNGSGLGRDGGVGGLGGGSGWRHPSAFNPGLGGMPPPPQSPGFNLSLGGLNGHNQGGGVGSGGGSGGGNGGFGGPHGQHGSGGPHQQQQQFGIGSGGGGGHTTHGSLSYGQSQGNGGGQGGGLGSLGMHGSVNNNNNNNGLNQSQSQSQSQNQNQGSSQLNLNGSHFGLGAQNSPPPGRPGQGQGVESAVGYWQQQLVKAEACRQSASPHHRARASALASRMVNQKTAVPILDPNRPSSAASSIVQHRKITSVSVRDDDASSDGLVSAIGHPSALTNTAGATAAEAKPEPWTGIDLGGIRLRTLTPSLFGFTHITTLYINHNSLTYLSPAISNLRHLTHLDVTGNQLQAVPPELGLISSLKELLLFDNNIQDLPLELGTLFQLEFLGIEGNPINENLRIAMSEKGTQGLIRYFRDNCPMPAPPTPRKWEILEEEVGTDGQDEEEFSIFSFNVLCERAATPQMYGYTPSWALDWSYRRDTIMQEITESMTDVICLQEVDDKQYNELFLPRMTELGYEGAFNLKTRARTMTTDEKRYVDGCATFWKSSKYQLVERRVIEFNQVALQKADMRTEDMFNRVMSKDNIALVCVFENIQTETRLVVSNAHHHWDAGDRDVKLVQVAMLVEETEKIAAHFARLPPKYISGQESRAAPRYSDATNVPLIICGDFNSIPDSAVYEYLSRGSVPADHEDFMGHEYGGYTAHGLAHRLGLKSAYAGIGELFMTNYTPGFVGPLDYIWYSHPTMTVTSVLGEVDKGYLAKTVGFPNCHFPSDHIPIAANFTLKPAATAPANAKRSYY